MKYAIFSSTFPISREWLAERGWLLTGPTATLRHVNPKLSSAGMPVLKPAQFHV